MRYYNKQIFIHIIFPAPFNGAHWEFQQSIDEYAEYLPIRPVKITKDEN